MSNTVFLVSGGFDPLHSGHIELLSIGSNVVVGLNSDQWIDTKRKDTKQRCHFMPWEERKAVLEAIATVSRVVEFDDSSGNAVEFLQWARDFFGLDRPLAFVNGGDRRSIKDVPHAEREAMDRLLIFPKFQQQGKRNSSRDILGDYLERTEYLDELDNANYMMKVYENTSSVLHNPWEFG